MVNVKPALWGFVFPELFISFCFGLVNRSTMIGFKCKKILIKKRYWGLLGLVHYEIKNGVSNNISQVTNSYWRHTCQFSHTVVCTPANCGRWDRWVGIRYVVCISANLWGVIVPHKCIFKCNIFYSVWPCNIYCVGHILHLSECAGFRAWHQWGKMVSPWRCCFFLFQKTTYRLNLDTVNHVLLDFFFMQ